jgi:capsular polysaccharide biosynthesis protein
VSLKFDALRRYAWVVLACAIIGAGAGYVIAKRSQKQYSATSVLLFDANASLRQLLGLASTSSSQDPTTVAATNVQLASLPALANLTSSALGPAAQQHPFSVSVSEAGSSNLVNVTATSPSPAFAAQVANTYANQFVKYVTTQQTSVVQQGITSLRRAMRTVHSSAQLGALQTQLSQLQALSAVQPVNVSVAQTATPPLSPSSPHPTRDAVLGLLIGALVGLAAVWALSRFDPRLHSLSAIDSDHRLTKLRWPRKLRRLSARPDRAAVGGDAEEVFKTVVRGTELRERAVESTLLLVTSSDEAVDAEARSAVAWDLAAAAAGVGPASSAALVDLSDGRSDFGRWVNGGAQHGWQDVVDHRVSIDGALHAVRVATDRSSSNGRSVDLLPPQKRADPGFDGTRIEALIDELTRSHRYVILVAPSPEEATVAGYAAEHADAIVAVAALHRTKRDSAQGLVDSLYLRKRTSMFLVGCAVA